MSELNYETYKLMRFCEQLKKFYDDIGEDLLAQMEHARANPEERAEMIEWFWKKAEQYRLS